jgi:hypothetical protein
VVLGFWRVITEGLGCRRRRCAAVGTIVRRGLLVLFLSLLLLVVFGKQNPGTCPAISFQHFDALLGEGARDVDSTCSLQEYEDDHPIGFVLGLFVRGVVCGKSKELENVRRINVLTQLLDQTLLRGVHL